MKEFDYSVAFMHSLFGKIGLKLSKPLTGMLAVLVVCLLGGRKRCCMTAPVHWSACSEFVDSFQIGGFRHQKTLISLIRLLRPKLEELDEIVQSKARRMAEGDIWD